MTVTDPSEIAESARDWPLEHFSNPSQAPPSTQLPADAPVQLSGHDTAFRYIQENKERLDYEPTPLLLASDELTKDALRIKRLVVKNETSRLGTTAFKVLGGLFAVANTAARLRAESCGPNPQDNKKITFVCCSAGNHGIGVARACALVPNTHCHVFLPRNVTDLQAKRVEQWGTATVHRWRGSYEEAGSEARRFCREHGYNLLQDGSTPGAYEDVPRMIFEGYTVLVKEMLEQLKESRVQELSHVLVNTGVGGLAVSVCSYLWATLGEKRPRFVVVEPIGGEGLMHAAKCGITSKHCWNTTNNTESKSKNTRGNRSRSPKRSDSRGEDANLANENRMPCLASSRGYTCQVGLDCKIADPLAWQTLSTGTNDFVAIGDECVEPTIRVLAADPALNNLRAGESAVAGVGVLLRAAKDDGLRKKLGLTEKSIVGVIVCEGPTTLG